MPYPLPSMAAYPEQQLCKVPSHVSRMGESCGKLPAGTRVVTHEEARVMNEYCIC